MLSRRTSSWKLHDWLFFIVIVLLFTALVSAALHGFAPNSGATQAINKAGLQVAVFLRWVAAFFDMLANWFASW